MRWGDMRKSDNVEDRGGTDAGRGGFPLGGGMKLGGGALVVVVILSLLFGVDPMVFLGGGAPTGGPGPAPGYGPQVAVPPAAPAATTDPAKDFAARVLGDTEDVWTALFQAMGSRYEKPKLVLFRGQVRSSCGAASAAVGPFYCSADRAVYLDTAFFNELSTRFKAPGDFAQAYVIAHEIGHHVQNQLGVMEQFERRSQRATERERNALSVRLELQADCFAGVWGHFAARRNLLEPGDLEEGLRAASAVGDDQIQKRAQGYVVPDSFTHGTADQRMRWFKTGLASGDPRVCDTFAAKAG
jgi:predicted metalloprotease